MLFQGTAQASTLYQNDFSGSTQPMFNWEIGGLAAPEFGISVNPSLESEYGNQYARLDVSTTGGNPSAGWRWYGGWYDAFAGLTAFPEQFRFSFDVSHAPVEPIRLTLEADSIKAPGILRAALRTYWVQPQGVGWQHIIIDQNSPYSEDVATWTTSQSPLFRMNVFLASHDFGQNPLSLSMDGTHSFFIDNVVLEVVPEPTALSFATVAATGALLVGLRRHRAASPS
jgi:hypothetical protein